MLDDLLSPALFGSGRISRSLLPPPMPKRSNRRCLFVCLLATLRKNFGTDLHENFREGWQWASEQKIKSIYGS